jgi:preprotein translocase subunit SecG
MNFIDWILTIVSILLVTIVALQSSKGDLGQAITGGNSELFKNQKERGADLFLSRATLVFTVIVVVLSFIRNYV